jgi:hypothetical protein
MILFGTTLFLSAFLLFVVQPLLGKYILPWFGGSPAVWTACMLFFQLLLLAGYSYAHLTVSRTNRRWQAAIHCIILLGAIVALPIIPAESWKPAGAQAPVLRILGLLCASVGAPYFLLAATAPLLQSWYGYSETKNAPYRLYALSNLGSLAAIIAYPLLIEPSITLGNQARYWTGCYLAFTLLCIICALKFLRSGHGHSSTIDTRLPIQQIQDDPSPSRTDRWMWLGLAACGSLVLLATTSQLCQDVAVVPLLWILPLGLYLISFILCFHSERWYSRIVFGPALAAMLIQTCIVLFGGVFVGLHAQIATYAVTLFVCCMVCHGELVRTKPSKRHLTSFYCLIALGGALGGAVASLVAPRLFSGFWEYHLSLLATSLLFLVALFRDQSTPLYHGRPAWAWSILYLAVIVLASALWIQIRDAQSDCVAITRNFFGILRVLEDEKDNPHKFRYTLMHGRIEHGFQFRDKEKRYWPTSYFGPNSGVGLAIRFHPKRTGGRVGQRNMRIGVVGLGTGTLATYGEPGDTIRFYEINPDVVRLSDSYFSFRKDCVARLEVALGDARISMERERSQRLSQGYDVLAIDAFSSDAIPVHLLTRECYRLYLYHLREDGILAFHISNRYFDLKPVIRNLAASDESGRMQAVWISAQGDESQGTDSTDWVLLTHNQSFLSSDPLKKAIRTWPKDDPAAALWTDDYSNLFKLLKR